MLILFFLQQKRRTDLTRRNCRKNDGASGCKDEITIENHDPFDHQKEESQNRPPQDPASVSESYPVMSPTSTSQLSETAPKLPSLDNFVNEYRCHLCSYTSNLRQNFIIHINSHAEQRPYRCRFCRETFSHKQNLKVHIRSHTGEKPFKCSFCTKSYSSNQNLKLHLLKHTEERYNFKIF